MDWTTIIGKTPSSFQRAHCCGNVMPSKTLYVENETSVKCFCWLNDIASWCTEGRLTEMLQKTAVNVRITTLQSFIAGSVT